MSLLEEESRIIIMTSVAGKTATSGGCEDPKENRCSAQDRQSASFTREVHLLMYFITHIDK